MFNKGDRAITARNILISSQSLRIPKGTPGVIIENKYNSIYRIKFPSLNKSFYMGIPNLIKI